MTARDSCERVTDAPRSSTWAVGVRDDGNGAAHVVVFYSIGDGWPATFGLSSRTARDVAASLNAAADVIDAARAKEADVCDSACTWRDHAPECPRSGKEADRG